MIVSNVPERVEWHCYRGDTATLTVFINDDAGDPVDVTTWTWAAVAVDEDGIETALTCIASVGAVTVTVVWPLESSTFDVQATKPDTTVWTPVRGRITVKDDVTP